MWSMFIWPFYRAFRYQEKTPEEALGAGPGTGKGSTGCSCLPNPEGKATTKFLAGGIATLLDRLGKQGAVASAPAGQAARP